MTIVPRIAPAFRGPHRAEHTLFEHQLKLARCGKRAKNVCFFGLVRSAAKLVPLREQEILVFPCDGTRTPSVEARNRPD